MITAGWKAKIISQPNMEGQEPDYKRFPVVGLVVEWRCPCGHAFTVSQGPGDYVSYPTFGKDVRVYSGECPSCEQDAVATARIDCQVTLTLTGDDEPEGGAA